MLTWYNTRPKQSVARSPISKHKYLFSSLRVLLLFLTHHRPSIVNFPPPFFLAPFEMVFTKSSKRSPKSPAKTRHAVSMRPGLRNPTPRKRLLLGESPLLNPLNEFQLTVNSTKTHNYPRYSGGGLGWAAPSNYRRTPVEDR